MSIRNLKRGDTTPEFTVPLEGAAQELTEEASIRFYMEAPPPEPDGQGVLVVNSPADAVDYASDPPTATYDFELGDTSRTGDHLAEFVVHYPDGEIQSFPSGEQLYTVTVHEPTNREAPPEEFDPPDITVGVVDADEVFAPALQQVETITGALTGGAALDTLAGPNLSIEDGVLGGIGDTQLTGEQVRTEVAAFLRASGAASIAYDDANDVLTISSTDENTQRSDEEIEDVVGALLSATGSASVNYDDSSGTLTIGATDTDTNTQLSGGEVQTIVEAYLAGGENVQLSTSSGTLTIAADHDHDGDQLGTSNPVSSIQATDASVESAPEAGTDVARLTDLADRLESATDERVEHGTVEIAPDSPPSDATWDTSNQKTATVTFDEAFATTPEIFFSGGGGIIGRGNVSYSDLTPSGFETVYRQFATSSTTTTYTVAWLAIGPAQT